MNPTNNLTPEHERLRSFLIASTKTFDGIYEYQLRSWLLKYAIYKRDEHGLGLIGLRPPIVPGCVRMADAVEWSARIDEVAVRIFGKKQDSCTECGEPKNGIHSDTCSRRAL